VFAVQVATLSANEELAFFETTARASPGTTSTPTPEVAGWPSGWLWRKDGWMRYRRISEHHLSVHGLRCLRFILQVQRELELLWPSTLRGRTWPAWIFLPNTR